MYKIFEQIINKRNLKLSDVAKGAGIPYSSLTDWKVGRSAPKVDKLCKIADFLDVSLDYLVRKKEVNTPNHYDITAYEYEIILAYRKADDIDKHSVDRVLRLEDREKESTA